MTSEATPAFLQKDQIYHRTFEVRSADKETRTVELSFSSDAEIERWYGYEILGHDAGEVRLERLRNSAPLLVNHDRNDQVGVIESVEIDASKGRAVVRFGKSKRAEEIFQDVVDGIRKLVSVGYRVFSAREIGVRDDAPIYRITDWEPYEISIVSIPADTSVGVGRSENAQEEPPAPVSQSAEHAQPTRGTIRMSDTNKPAPDLASERKAGAEAENIRSATILSMGEQYKALELASQYVREGKSVGEFQDALLKRFDAQTNKPLSEQMRSGEIGMSEKEVKKFSLMRAVRFLVNPADATARKEAAFEIECSRAASDKSGKDPKGILIPIDVLVSRAFSLTAPVGGAGANIVGTDLLAGSFIDMLMKKSFALGRGTKLGGLVGNVDIPRQKSGTTGYWVGEGGEPTGSEVGTDKISLAPKTLGAFSDVTRKMLLQATPDAEALTRNDILKTMALTLDKACLYGSGSSNQPLGLRGQSGLAIVDFAGVRPTNTELIQMETEVAQDDADVGSLAYVSNARFRGHAKSTPKFGSGTEATIWEQGGTVNGYECPITNQITDGDVFYGNWSDLLIAMWSGIDLTVDLAALAKSGGVRVIALQDVDINVRHVESFCLGYQATP